MNNKTLKRVVALVATVLLVCSCAFAATIGDVTYDAETGALSVPFTAEGATKAMLLVKDASGEIVAAAQFNNLTKDTVAFNETIDPTKLANGDTLTVSVGDNAAGSTLAATKTVNVPAYYTVTIDGEATIVAAGTLISELLPAKESYQDETTVYTFDGWYVGEEKLAADATVAADVEIKSVFTSAPRKYVVKFVDEDGTELKSEEVAYGATPVAPEAPSKEANEKYTYEFAGWTPEIVAVAGDATYTATYTETARAYTVTWVVEGVETTETYAYGEMPEYKGEAPVKAGDAQYSYNFVGWGEIAEVTGDATYTAEFEQVVNNYTITYIVDGVETTETLAYGATPAPADPVKAATAQYTYTFAGWSPAIAEVTADATYTATYNETVNSYTVTFVDWDGTVLSEQTVAYGDTPVAPADPERADTAEIDYTFAGWDSAVVPVTGNATYTATYSEEAIVPEVETFTVTFVSEGATVSEVAEVAAGTAFSTLVPAEPTKDKYAFIGWYLDEALTIKMADNTVAANTTLYAKLSMIGVYGDSTGDGVANTRDLREFKKFMKDGYTGIVGTNMIMVKD